jgi:hypothetical protein
VEWAFSEVRCRILHDSVGYKGMVQRAFSEQR